MENADEVSRYSHSPVHLAVLKRDYSSLRRILTILPRLPKAGEVKTEEESIAAERIADIVSATIDRRDVPGRETPLHVAVRKGDEISTEMLMAAGADWSLQNQNGWNALQEAVCARQDSIAMTITRHYQPLAWAKWCRRLPRIVATASRMRDFYMEISFHFESSVIPFIGRIAPSDTYKIWKRSANLRADMTLAGFDGFRIQRSDLSFVFLGDGNSEKGLPAGSLLVLSHKEKEISNALEGAGNCPTETEVTHEVNSMAQTNLYRPGIDVTQAELAPHLNWRRQERVESVGHWKAKVYDMNNVLLSVKSRRVPGALTDEELFGGDGDEDEGIYDGVLSQDERQQLDMALSMKGTDEGSDEEACDGTEINYAAHKKGWFGWSRKGVKKSHQSETGNAELVSEDRANKGSRKKKKSGGNCDCKHESEYKKGLRPVLWLTKDFPLRTEEFLPLLDILANKVKAIQRLRELLTTKLPPGTFPVKVRLFISLVVDFLGF
eukprot:TRINITY_DN5092_c0_g1_i3.p1 TRINITY_DN5092_c0_g1~~TRINITY_DN5092_c0_g1_i3.p1  ORF type:complete len:494 (-),score=29.51 TRINITY_DN5092_c0_g1_i3:436-1917(-)